MRKVRSKKTLAPQPALIIQTEKGLGAFSPVKKHLLGVFNDKNQFIIQRGNELVIVEVPTK